MMEFPYSLEELEAWKIDLIEAIWVALTVKDTKWNLFLVLEKEKKVWKKPGQWSTVMETYKKEDKCFLTTVKRWLKEELWINIDNWEKIWPEDIEIISYVYDSENSKVYKVFLHLYDVALTDEQSKQALSFTNWEVEKVKLVDLEDLKLWKISPLRPGTEEVFFWDYEPLFIIDGKTVAPKN